MAGGGGDRGEYSYPGKFTTYIALTCVVAAMAGLLDGYNVGISGGVTTMPSFLKEFFPSVYHQKQQADNYCKFNSPMLTFFTSSLYASVLISCVVPWQVLRKHGRKLCMFFGGILLCAGALLNGFASHLWMLIVGRILLGFGICFVNQVVPRYLFEVASWEYSGVINTGFHLSFTLGFLLASLVNVNVNLGWRWSLGGSVVPALILTICSLVLPETPQSLVERGRKNIARLNLQRIRGVNNVDKEFNDLVAACEKLDNIKNSFKNILKRKYRPYLTLSLVLQFFEQFTGVKGIMIYAPVLFNTIGFGNTDSLSSAVIIGKVYVVVSFVAIFVVVNCRRRFLFLQGGIQMLISQIVVAIAISNMRVDVVPLFICAYVSGSVWSWEPLVSFVPNKIFPVEIQSAGFSISVIMKMYFTFVVAQIFPSMLCHLKFGLFLFFAFWMVVMTIFVYFFLPETKDAAKDEMMIVWKKHWFWKRFMTDVDYSRFPYQLDQVLLSKA